MAGTAVGALMAHPALANLSGAIPSIGGGSPPGTLTSVVVGNIGPGAMAANSFVQFGHPFGASDLPSGTILSIEDETSTSVPYTAMARSAAGGTSTRYGDLVCRLPNSIAAPLTLSSITHSSTTATATTSSAHGLSSGAVVKIYGAAPDDYVGDYAITVTGASTFTYTMQTTPASNATTPGQMCYTRVLSLNTTSGSWNNTLPNSLTSANILSDVTTNFDNISIQLTSVTNSAGSTVASGTFNADFATASALTPTAGQLRTITSRQGQLVCDFLALMKFNDSVTPTTHLGSMSAWFYLTAFCDQTTGAVQEVRCRVWIDNSLANTAMDYMTYQAAVKLGSTVIQSTGLSSSASVDGKTQSFAPAAVNTGTNLINLPSHGFVGGETVRFTNSGGGLPSGLSTNTDYPVVWVDANNIAIGGVFDENNQLGHSSYVSLGTQGTGTHTVKAWLHSTPQSRVPYCRVDGLQYRWTGKTGAQAPITYHVSHSNTYLQATKMVPPVDLTINLPARAAFRTGPGTNFSDTASYSALDQYCYGAFGSLQYAQNAGGAGAFHEYGGPWTDKPLRRLRYTYDPGFAQTLRVDAMMMGGMGFALINDDTLWRIPCVNNGPARNGVAYTGLPTPAPNSCFYAGFQVGFTSPTVNTLANGQTAAYSTSHRYILAPRLYMFEGGQDIHDFMTFDAAMNLLGNTPGAGVTMPTTGQISAKNYSISGTTYYTNISGSEQRTDAWTVQIYADFKFLGDEACVEKPYLLDCYSDWIFVANWLNNTFAPSVNVSYNVLGGWQYGEVARLGPGNVYAAQCDAITGFFQSYLGSTWGHCLRMDSTNTNFATLMGSFYTLVDVLYRQTAANGAFSNTYGIRCMQAADSAANSTLTNAAITDPVFQDSNLSDGVAAGFILYQTNGVIVGCSSGNFVDVYPANGDRHYLTDTGVAGNVAPGDYPGPPSANIYKTYYVQNASGSYLNWQYSTTNSGVGLISSYAAFNSNTLSAAVTSSGQTTIQTTTALTFPSQPFGANVVVIGNEVMSVTAGKGTTTLTVQRGQFGTTATTYSNGATIYVPYTSTLFADYQNRTVAFPPTGHAYRITGAAAAAPDGYLTMMRSQAFYGWLTGNIVKTAFNNADAWFNDATAPAGAGPGAFAANNTLKDSVNTTFTS